MERQHLSGIGSLLHQLQTFCQAYLRSLPRGRAMVRYWTRIHNASRLEQIFLSSIWLAINWLPRKPGTILLLSRWKCLLRKSYLWHALQDLSICRNHYFRNKCWGYGRTMGVLSWTMCWHWWRRSLMDGKISSHESRRRLRHHYQPWAKDLQRLERFRMPYKFLNQDHEIWRIRHGLYQWNDGKILSQT